MTPFAARTDTELIRAARDDPAAFEALFERHAMALRGWLLARTGDESVAADLLGETFARAWRGARRFRGSDPGSGAAWLYGIARHLVHQHYRRGRVETAARRRLGMSIEAATDGGIEALPARIDARERGGELRAALAALSGEQRRAIAGRVVEQRSYAALAADLECDTTTARTRVHRGLRALRAAMTRGT